MQRKMGRSKTTVALEESAWHEAGHAVVALALGFSLDAVSIERSATAGGYADVLAPTEWGARFRETARGSGAFRLVERKRLTGGKAAIQKMIIYTFAGFAAQRLKNPRASTSGIAQDFEDIISWSKRYRVLPPGRRKFVDDDQHRIFLHNFEREAQRLVKKLRGPIEKLALLLLRRQTLTGAEVKRAVGRVSDAS
jgi:hypothetical protein